MSANHGEWKKDAKGRRFHCFHKVWLKFFGSSPVSSYHSLGGRLGRVL